MTTKNTKQVLQDVLNSLPAEAWGKSETKKGVDLLTGLISSCEKVDDKEEYIIKFRRYEADFDGQSCEASWSGAACKSYVKLDVGAEYILFAVLQSDAIASAFEGQASLKEKGRTKIKEVLGVYRKLTPAASAPAAPKA